ncbi:jg9002 [Pararge aegeria aegeria]|uniref:Jg9002 protein n=1 Tax=Pararge aegeria aegeria TaxID=348720 RepID=A0A8S4SR37_9NEOP|nr:jg9002 [Pararge aegeria aegeria]
MFSDTIVVVGSKQESKGMSQSTASDAGAGDGGGATISRHLASPPRCPIHHITSTVNCMTAHCCRKMGKGE